MVKIDTSLLKGPGQRSPLRSNTTVNQAITRRDDYVKVCDLRAIFNKRKQLVVYFRQVASNFSGLFTGKEKQFLDRFACDVYFSNTDTIETVVKLKMEYNKRMYDGEDPYDKLKDYTME